MTNRNTSGGPWILDLPALDPGESVEMYLKSLKYRGRKGYFRDWLPLDNATIKNRDPENAALVTFNGQYEVLVEPNAADTYGETGINSIAVENTGTTTLADGNLVLQVSAEAFDADDAARAKRNQSPVSKVAQGLLGL